MHSKFRGPRSQFLCRLVSLSPSHMTVLNRCLFLFRALLPDNLKKRVLIMEVELSSGLTYSSIFCRRVFTKIWLDSTGSFFILSRAETRKEVNSDSQSPKTVYANTIVFNPTSHYNIISFRILFCHCKSNIVLL